MFIICVYDSIINNTSIHKNLKVLWAHLFCPPARRGAARRGARLKNIFICDFDHSNHYYYIHKRLFEMLHHLIQ